MSKLISIITQKGGAGKSTLTMLFSSFLYYELNREVIVLDCDYPQHSIADRRLADQQSLEDNPALKEEFTARGKKALPVFKLALSEAPETIRRLKDTDNKDIVFLDLPGTMNQPGYTGTIAQLDAAIIPIEADELSFSSALMTIEVFAKIIEKTGRPFPMYVIWNRVNLSEKQEKLEALQNFIINHTQARNIPVQILETKVRQLVTWKNNRSTLKANNKVEEIITELLDKKIFDHE